MGANAREMLTVTFDLIGIPNRAGYCIVAVKDSLKARSSHSAGMSGRWPADEYGLVRESVVCQPNHDLRLQP